MKAVIAALSVALASASGASSMAQMTQPPGSTRAAATGAVPGMRHTCDWPPLEIPLSSPNKKCTMQNVVRYHTNQTFDNTAGFLGGPMNLSKRTVHVHGRFWCNGRQFCAQADGEPVPHCGSTYIGKVQHHC